MGQSLRAELREIHENHAIRVTLLEPGGVETPFFEKPGSGRLEADDVARTVLYVVDQPAHVDVTEIVILPTAQRG
jgi:NADP-dependent 3-hydroxy acid dehydrogenase YdfG